MDSAEVKRLLKQEILEQEELTKAAKELNKRNAEYESLPDAESMQWKEGFLVENEYVDPGFYSRENAHQEKLFMMVGALFLKHFTPIDEELL